MKFVVSSIDLLNHLQSASRVINPKNNLPILDNFLFKLEGNRLEITASDLETTLVTAITLENASDEGIIAIPARILTESLKEFSDQPLAFDINTDNYNIVISSENGQFSVMGQNGDDFPQLPQIKEEKKVSFKATSEALLNGISTAIFATADDALRPVMNGIFFELTDNELTFVASDAHKLVRYKRFDIKADETGASFILPKKPAAILKNILVKEQNQISVAFDDKNAFFNFADYRLICRLVEGNYPSYNSVIPVNNPNKLVIDRLRLLNTIKRVSVFSNQASNLVRLKLTGNKIAVSAQDIDLSTSAYEELSCQYNGDDMEIGFKAAFLIEILNNLQCADVSVELSDPSRAGLFLPLQRDNENEDVLMLLMPMMIGS